jgi:hypothetical protein
MANTAFVQLAPAVAWGFCQITRRFRIEGQEFYDRELFVNEEAWFKLTKVSVTDRGVDVQREQIEVPWIIFPSIVLGRI